MSVPLSRFLRTNFCAILCQWLVFTLHLNSSPYCFLGKVIEDWYLGIWKSLQADSMQPQLQPGPQMVPHQLEVALQQYVQLHPECMELDSRLANWVLAHCHDLPT